MFAVSKNEAIKAWQDTDPVMADLAQATDIPERYDGDAPFTSLVRSICHQQISLAAGETVFGRLAAATGPSPEGILAHGETLREHGLSRPKVTYLLDLAEAVDAGRLDLQALPQLDDADVIKQLTAVKGIGVWTAKMYLMFQLRRPDVCPWEDLGVRQGVEQVYGVPEKEAASWLKEHHHRWSPHNSMAARVLWAARRSQAD